MGNCKELILSACRGIMDANDQLISVSSTFALLMTRGWSASATAKNQINVLQIAYCDQLTAYLSKFLIVDAETAPADAAATVEAASIDGYKVGPRHPASIVRPM